MKICVFGGAFDPLHLGHENLIKTLLSKFDKVIIMPSRQSPGKNIPGASDDERLKMLSLSSFINNPNLIIDHYELKSSKGLEPSFTINSIQYIKNKFKEDDIYLALGLDQFNNLSNWYNIQALLDMVKIICFNRNELINENIKVDYEIIEDFNYDISSSEIKNLIQSYIDKIKNMVNEKIFNYIMKE